MRYIFLVSGYSKSGKDHFTDYVIKYKNLKKYSIATELKTIVQRKYNLNHKLLETQDGKSTIVLPTGETVRDLLIKEALILKRFNKDIFITGLLDTITINDYINTTSFTKLDNVIISDFRYASEYACIKRNSNLYLNTNTKIITIRINRFSEAPDKIESEINLDNFKFTHYIDNTKTIKYFEKNINKFMKFYQF